MKLILLCVWAESAILGSTKAELPKVGVFFHTQFTSLGIFINKKIGNRKKLRPASIQL